MSREVDGVWCVETLRSGYYLAARGRSLNTCTTGRESHRRWRPCAPAWMSP